MSGRLDLGKSVIIFGTKEKEIRIISNKEYKNLIKEIFRTDTDEESQSDTEEL